MHILSRFYKLNEFKQSYSLWRRLFDSRHQKRLTWMQQQADVNLDDVHRQQKFLEELLKTKDYQGIIQRCEHLNLMRQDKECAHLYLIALYENGELDKAAKLLTSDFSPILNSSSSSETSSSTNGSNGHRLNLGSSPNQPLYIVNANEGSIWWRRLYNFFNVAVIVAIGYSLYQLAEQKLSGPLSPRVHKLFNVSDFESSENKNKKKKKKNVTTFQDVHGCDEAKQDLQDVVDFLKNPHKYDRLGARLPKGILLYGPPGTGKTLLAKAVAGEAEVPFFYAAGSEFDQMFVGLGSLRIKEMFEAARRQAPSIIFIDELDAVGSRRNARDPQHSRLSLNQLLVELDGFDSNSPPVNHESDNGSAVSNCGVIVMAATNMPESLDKALLRPGRFDRHIHIPLPDMIGRKSILQHYLGSNGDGDNDVNNNHHNVDVSVLARGTPGFSGADLCKLVNQGRMHASRDNAVSLAMQHLEQARDEIILGSHRKLLMTEEDRRLTAVHESGHALIAHLRRPLTHPIHKATIVPRGASLGLVAQLPERDEVSASKAQLLAKLDVLMGGRVAEEIVFGADNITTGAGSDFVQATRLARAMVTKYGMSDKLGPVIIDDYSSNHRGGGEESSFAPGVDEISPQTRLVIDLEIKELLDSAKQRAHIMITQHLANLHRLANELLQRETLTRIEIEAILC